MKERKSIKPRLPIEAVNLLRTRGGVQTTKKGKKGYDRNKEKEDLRRAR
jgi:hypothetical protein